MSDGTTKDLPTGATVAWTAPVAATALTPESTARPAARPGREGDGGVHRQRSPPIAARADIDNGGLELRLPMPDWLTEKNPKTGDLLTTQDFADIYAYMKTQTQ